MNIKYFDNEASSQDSVKVKTGIHKAKSLEKFYWNKKIGILFKTEY